MKLASKNNVPVNDSRAATFELQGRCGAFFQEKRKRAKSSLEEVADYLAIPVETLQAYESGKVGIPLDQVQSMSNCLNIHPDEIMELFHELSDSALIGWLSDQGLAPRSGFGEVIKEARKTVSLTVQEVVKIMVQYNYSITETELLRLEKGEQTPTVEFWIHFSRLLHLPNHAMYGYFRSEHIQQLRLAIERFEVRIPISSKLMTDLWEFVPAIGANEEF